MQQLLRGTESGWWMMWAMVLLVLVLVLVLLDERPFVQQAPIAANQGDPRQSDPIRAR